MTLEFFKPSASLTFESVQENGKFYPIGGSGNGYYDKVGVQKTDSFGTQSSQVLLR